ncbi:hypothetical protein [Cellulomonas sp. URHD0024]|uniref:hypothetical protein n=1 Tax=Cellulomonas sp. URHD0024 TaxID=1302620 RepID=UPI000481FEA2|nr:hypothetical protein [Cellulomonas sp. URHD0024]
MLWFSVWTLLVLATLAGAFFLGRRLWRSGVALGKELGRAAEVLGQLAVRVDELQRAAEALRPETGPTVLADPGEMYDRYAELRVAAAGRRVVRANRRAATRRAWKAYWR